MAIWIIKNWHRSFILTMTTITTIPMWIITMTPQTAFRSKATTMTVTTMAITIPSTTLLCSNHN